MTKRFICLLLSAILLLGVLPVSPSAIAWAEELPTVEEAVIPPVKDLPETIPAETPPAEELPEGDTAIPSENETPTDEPPTENTSENDTPAEITAENEAESLLYDAASGQCGDNVFWNISGTTLTIYGTGAMWDYPDSPWYGRDITDVVVNHGVTTVGECAFADCWNLQRISLPHSITAIQYGAFYYCPFLQSISLPSSVERIGKRAFQFCGALSSVSLPDSITTVEPYAFSNCWNLQTVTMPKNLHTIGSGAFSYCNTLSSISLPDSVTDIAYFAFGWCGRLSSVKMPERLNSIGEAAFYNCYNLRSIDIPQGLTALPVGVFQNSGLQSVTIPEGITRIGASAFSSCESLTSCHLPNSLTVIDDCAFIFCRNLQNIAFPSELQTVGNSAFYCSGLTSITLPSSLYALGSYAFANTYISYAWIPANLKNHDGTAFRYCRELSAINVSIYNSEYTSVNGVLFDKSGTTLFQYPCAKSGSFYDVPSGVTTIADSAFESTRYLHGVTIPVGVNSIGRWAFSNCEKLETISIPKSITIWGISAFSDCRNLKQVILEDGLTTIGECAFSSTGISKISLPASVNTIESGAFCSTKLTTLTLPEGVARLGESAFAYCDSLATVSLPQSLAYIGPEAFSGCYTLETADYAGTYQQWQNKVYVSSNNNCLTNVLQYADSLRLSDDLAQMEGATLTLRTADGNNPVGESKITHGRVSLVAIADGNYSVTISRKGYVSAAVMAAVADNAISLSEELTMIRRGNVNGVNDVDIIDVQCLYEYLATRVPKGAFKNNPALLRQVGDVNEDGILNILDFEALYQQVVASSGGGGSGNAPGDGKVYYLNFKPEQDDAWKALAAAYTEETSVPVTVVTAASGTYDQTLMDSIAKADAPTLFQVNGPVGLANWKEYCYDLSSSAVYGELTSDDFALKEDGAVYGIAYVIESYGLITNTALLEKAGYTTDDIKSFDDLKKVAEDITARKDELGFAAFTSAGMDSSSDWRFKTHLANLPIYFEYKDAGIGISTTIKGTYLDNYKNIFDLYINNSTCDPKVLAGKTGTDSENEFLNGEAVFFQNGSWEYYTLSTKYSDNEMAMIPIYIGVGDEANQGLCTGTENYWCVNKNASEEDIQATLDFLYWCVTSDKGTKDMANEMGFVIPFKGALESNNLFVKQDKAMTAEGKTPVSWNFAAMPSEDWKNGVGSALTAYAAGTGGWNAVKTAFVDGWASEYAMIR